MPHRSPIAKRPRADRAPDKDANRRGSVLVAVLAVIALLSFLVTRFMEEALRDLEYRAIFNEPTEARVFAHGALEATLAAIREVALIDDGKLHAPEQGWGEPLAYAGVDIPEGWDVAVTVRDEGGKLPLNTLSEPLLNRLFEATFELDYGTARELSATLLDWTDANESPRLNGAESEFYLTENPPYRAADAPLQSLDELRLLKVWRDVFFDESGRPNALFRRFAGMVSVRHNGPVNVNAAPPEVLELLALENGWDPDYLFDGLDQPYRESAPGAADSDTTGAETRLLHITVRVSRGGVPYVISALVAPEFGGGANGGNADESGGAGGNRPGATARDQPRTGTPEEQRAIRFPYRILRLTEYEGAPDAAEPARYSAVDIGSESGSFPAAPTD